MHTLVPIATLSCAVALLDFPIATASAVVALEEVPSAIVSVALALLSVPIDTKLSASEISVVSVADPSTTAPVVEVKVWLSPITMSDVPVETVLLEPITVT